MQSSGLLGPTETFVLLDRIIATLRIKESYDKINILRNIRANVVTSYGSVRTPMRSHRLPKSLIYESKRRSSASVSVRSVIRLVCCWFVSLTKHTECLSLSQPHPLSRNPLCSYPLVSTPSPLKFSKGRGSRTI